MKVAVAVLLSLISLASARIVNKQSGTPLEVAEVCYQHYGCFSTAAPWTSTHRPLSATPNPPYEVGTRFILFTRGNHENEEIGYELLPDKDAILRFSDFKPERKTYFIIHGFTDSHKTEWAWDIKNLLLQNEDVNIISVDWAPGAKSPYLQATANARLTGAQIARMITYLEQAGDLNINDVHVISHSLGSHVAGYAGDRLMGRIPKLTAIDPMDPYFAGTDPVVRLDTTDAKFVEVIHSNGRVANNLALGINEAIGHLDIYPNGGVAQPGCRDTLRRIIRNIDNLIKLDIDGSIGNWACSHMRAAHFYAESITNADTCPFVAFECANYNDFERGLCYQTCSEEGKCISLGHYAKRLPQTTGVYYLKTTDGTDNKPYCNQVVQIQMAIGMDQEATIGTFNLRFSGTNGSLSDRYVLLNSSRMQPGQLATLWVEVPSSVFSNTDEQPELIWRYNRGGLLQSRTLSIDYLNLIVIKSDLSSVTRTYKGQVVETGVDTPISS